MNNCIFCKIIKKEIPSKIIYENDFVYSFLDITPNSDGHCLIVPKKHYENFEQTDKDYLHHVLDGKIEVLKILNTKLPKKPLGYNFVTNQGEEAFQTVFHYHEHIIPKYKKNKGYTFLIKNNPDDLSDLDVLYSYFKK
ncbi:HIT family protein [Spiroplasma tabanidicola]|uniref:Histidine triad protein n=1 Tax=Spiroplasma tabanidicola TaxID=324079 RepID=A0A6I6C7K3_9MOLU|nr:HIT family protein [Spiroplasma tabanidicola]QGS52200.1 histidine triad protein [Spiroplasma tabanidicola]